MNSNETTGRHSAAPALSYHGPVHVTHPLCSGPGGALDYEPGADKSIAAIAERGGRSPHEVAYDIMLEGGGKGFIYLPMLDYTDGSHDNMREMMTHPLSVFGL